MRSGRWIPLSKALVNHLPHDRKYTELEAMFSLQLDYDNQADASISGYSKQWGWSRTKVKAFLSRSGVSIINDDFSRFGGELSVEEKEQDTGQQKSRILDSKRAAKEQQRFIDSKGLAKRKNIKKTLKKQDTGQQKSRILDSTIDPNPNPNPLTFCANEENFEIFWEAFGYKKGGAPALKAWLKIKMDAALFVKIIAGAKAYATKRPRLLNDGQTPKYPQGWLNDERWNDEESPEQPKKMTGAELVARYGTA